jgi:hypothetical protein
VLPLAAGIGAGSLTDPADLHPVYRNAMLICAGLLVAGGIVAAIFVPSRLPAHTPPPPAEPVSPAPPPEPAALPARPVFAQANANPVRSFCDPSGPPVHPRDRSDR